MYSTQQHKKHHPQILVITAFILVLSGIAWDSFRGRKGIFKAGLCVGKFLPGVLGDPDMPAETKSFHSSWQRKKNNNDKKAPIMFIPLLHQLLTSSAVTHDVTTEVLVSSHQICTSPRHLLTCPQAMAAWLPSDSGGNWWLFFVIFITDRKNSDFLRKKSRCETGEQIWSGSIQAPGNK